MSIETQIQWCDSTVNPVMGCEGCELWPTPGQLRQQIKKIIGELNLPKLLEAQMAVDASFHDLSPTDIYHGRQILASQILVAGGVPVSKKSVKKLIAEIKKPFRCYAGILHTRHGADDLKPEKRTNKGYAVKFEQPRLFPGRTLEAAGWSDLRGLERANDPWLSRLRRLIFVSDMGDALSRSVTFGYLKTEIIDAATSPKGRRHIWLWLTKRPNRMAKFCKWLNDQGIDWPENIVAMTSVTSRKTLIRVDQLREVNCALRGLSVEPLWESIELDFEGISWVITGGESACIDHPFDLQWAREIRDQCVEAENAFFLKQLGSNPVENGVPFPVKHPHGGDWNEWPEDLRIRQFPAAFR